MCSFRVLGLTEEGAGGGGVSGCVWVFVRGMRVLLFMCMGIVVYKCVVVCKCVRRSCVQQQVVF